MRKVVLVILKHEAIQRNLVGQIITVFEEKGAKLLALKMCSPAASDFQKLYAEHSGRAYFDRLIAGMMRGPIIAMAISCPRVSDSFRIMKIVQGKYTIPGTVRGRFTLHESAPLLHISSSESAAKRETKIFFKPEDLTEYDKSCDVWLVSEDLH